MAFDGTRYYINLITSALNDMKYFFIIFAYSTTAFGLLLIVSSDDFLDFNHMWGNAYALNFGKESIENILDELTLQYFFYFLASVINVVLMLNLLVSILGDSYDKFQLNKIVVGFKEKACLSLEIQKMIIWNKNKNREEYIHSVVYATQEIETIEESAWEGKLKYLQANFKKDFQLLESKIEKNKLKIVECKTANEEKMKIIEEKLEKIIKFLKIE